MDIARYFSLRSVGSALRLQRTAGAIVFAGSIKNGATVIDPTGGLQSLPLRAGIQVPVGIEDEVVARERRIIALAHVPDRDVRRYACSDQPVEEPAGTVSSIGGKPAWLETEPLLSPLDHYLGRGDLVVSPGRSRFHIDDHRVLNIDQVIEPVTELHALVRLRCPGRTPPSVACGRREGHRPQQR